MLTDVISLFLVLTMNERFDNDYFIKKAFFK